MRLLALVVCLAVLEIRAGELTDDVFSRVADEKGISRALLYAIASTESRHGGRPWPWTLNVDGRSLYYPDRETAHAALVGFLRQGVRSIDVGWMQVNLAYHAARFPNTWIALDPYWNLAAAADILRENYVGERDVTRAVAYYHSRTPWRAGPYLQRVTRNYRFAVSAGAR